jgi:hypothetical protein
MRQHVTVNMLQLMIKYENWEVLLTMTCMSTVQGHLGLSEF